MIRRGARAAALLTVTGVLVLLLVPVLVQPNARAGPSVPVTVPEPTVATGPGRPVPDTQGAPGVGGRVLVVSIPDLTWSDVSIDDTPAIGSIIASGASALLSTRTADDVDGPAAAYLTLGAGRRAGAAPGPLTGAAEQLPVGVLVPGFEAQVERNDELRYGARAGALGDALAAAGVDVAVVGDAGATSGGPADRSVALGTADSGGRTPLGRVDGLLRADPRAPGGAWLDRGAVLAAAASALSAGGVVLVEASDLQRAVDSAATGEGEPGVVADGLARTDALVAELVALIDPARDTVLLLSPTSPRGDRMPAVFSWRSPGVVPGTAVSASTRRDGHVALTDIASTVLVAAGVTVPDGVADTPVTAAADDRAAAERIDDLSSRAQRAVDRDATVGPVAVAALLLAVVCGLSGIWCVRRNRTMGTPARLACLATMSVPAAAFTVGAGPGVGVGVPVVLLWVGSVATAVGLAAEGVGRRLGPGWAPTVPAASTVLLLVADVVTGARLQLDTPLGYSATVAGRFAGLGNQASAYLLVSALVVVAAGWVVLAARGWSRRALLTAASVVSVVVVVVTAAPWWGADVGGVLTALPALVVVVALSAQRGRLRWRVVAGAAAALVGAMALLLLVGVWDRARPAAEQTHLGRFVEDLVTGGAPEVLGRKLSAAWEVTASTPWSLAAPVLLLALGSLAWVPGRGRWAVAERHPELSAFGGAVALAGFVGWAVNDSGVAVPAAMLVIAVPYVACAAAADRPPPGAPDAAGVRSVVRSAP